MPKWPFPLLSMPLTMDATTGKILHRCCCQCFLYFSYILYISSFVPWKHYWAILSLSALHHTILEGAKNSIRQTYKTKTTFNTNLQFQYLQFPVKIKIFWKIKISENNYISPCDTFCLLSSSLPVKVRTLSGWEACQSCGSHGNHLVKEDGLCVCVEPQWERERVQFGVSHAEYYDLFHCFAVGPQSPVHPWLIKPWVQKHLAVLWFFADWH